MTVLGYLKDTFPAHSGKSIIKTALSELVNRLLTRYGWFFV